VNLEHLVKHIIRKFRDMELQHSELRGGMAELRSLVDSKAAGSSVDQVEKELNDRIGAVRHLAVSQKENISTLEVQTERNRVATGALEKKLEASMKDKAVQDRLIREAQEELQDKVGVAELNLFEAKFAGYTTKMEMQDMLQRLAHCARVETTEGIAESVRNLEARFEGYTRTAKLSQQLQELRDWVTEELEHYARSAKTNEHIDELRARVQEQAAAAERTGAASEDKLRALSDRVTSIFAELQNDVHRALAHAEDIQRVKEKLKSFAIKAETNAFQQDVEPKLRFCVDRIRAFDEKVLIQDDAIRRVDEVLLDKAAKFDVTVVSQRIDECMQKDAATAEFQGLHSALERFGDDLAEYKAAETQRMEQWRPPDYGPQIQELGRRCDLKADRADLVEMYQLKANRVDADELAKLQETIHRQLEYLAVTTFGLSKLTLTEARPDSKTVRTQQKSQVLMQSEALWNWILHNEQPPNLDALRPPPGKDADAGRRQSDGAKRGQLEHRLGLAVP